MKKMNFYFLLWQKIVNLVLGSDIDNDWMVRLASGTDCLGNRLPWQSKVKIVKNHIGVRYRHLTTKYTRSFSLCQQLQSDWDLTCLNINGNLVKVKHLLSVIPDGLAQSDHIKHFLLYQQHHICDLTNYLYNKSPCPTKNDPPPQQQVIANQQILNQKEKEKEKDKESER